MPEISDAELAQLRKGYTLLETLMKDKDQGLSVKRALQAIDTSLRFPEVEIADGQINPVRAELDATKQALEALKAELQADKEKAANESLEQKLRAGIDRVALQHGLTADGKAGLIKLMSERQVADPDVAVAFFLKSLPPTPEPLAPSPFMPAHANLYGSHTVDADMEALHRNPQQWADAKATEILNGMWKAA